MVSALERFHCISRVGVCSLSVTYMYVFFTIRASVNDLAQSLLELCGSKLVALTDGSSGSIIATRDHVSECCV